VYGTTFFCRTTKCRNLDRKHQNVDITNYHPCPNPKPSTTWLPQQWAVMIGSNEVDVVINFRHFGSRQFGFRHFSWRPMYGIRCDLCLRLYLLKPKLEATDQLERKPPKRAPVPTLEVGRARFFLGSGRASCFGRGLFWA
jgi:hypothetical protein